MVPSLRVKATSWLLQKNFFLKKKTQSLRPLYVRSDFNEGLWKGKGSGASLVRDDAYRRCAGAHPGPSCTPTTIHDSHLVGSFPFFVTAGKERKRERGLLASLASLGTEIPVWNLVGFLGSMTGGTVAPQIRPFAIWSGKFR